MKEEKKAQHEIEDVKRKILPILEHYGVTKAGLFGSFVRGELREDSDIDILVEIEKD
ncbi:MAG: nucleotidyltransferase domain-containing protein, partial [Bacteroidota bacterium]